MPVNQHTLNKRYAKALLGLAIENNILERSFRDMKTVYTVFAENKTLKILLKSPVIRVSKKQNVLRHLFEKSMHPLILRYMMIIVKKQRGSMLDGISAAYLTVYKQYLGIETVKITTALPLNAVLRDRAMEAARKITPYEIEFEERIDPELIGGFILNLGDKQYDASIKNRLSRVKKHLTKQ